MKFVFSKEYSASREEIFSFIEHFEEEGLLLGDGARNKLKIFPFNGTKINIKSFQVPNVVNKIAYRFFRKSKAERSYNYAHYLISKAVGTPFPIAYAEEKSGFLFRRSYYLSEHLKSDLTYRELVQNPDFPQHESILRAFTEFTFSLHEKNIEFLDHSPGNTLIQLNAGDFKFFLVDLNRMNFRKLDFDARMKNFSRLTPKKEMIKIMANQYAKLYNRPENEVFEKMWFYTEDFQRRFRRKKEMKKKLKFWKRK